MTTVKEQVQHYYSEILHSSSDLKTDACCASGKPPAYIQPLLENIHEDVTNRFYGCGYPLSEALKGIKVVDLGCGTGRDVYLYSQLVGSEGFVFGIDMTDSQLETAKSVQDWQMKKFAYSKANVDFRKGYIEYLGDCGLEDNSIDLVVSKTASEAASIRLLDSQTLKMVSFGSFGLEDLKRAANVPVSKSIAGLVVKENRSIIVPSILKDPLYQSKKIIATKGFHSLIAVPLRMPSFVKNEGGGNCQPSL